MATAKRKVDEIARIHTEAKEDAHEQDGYTYLPDPTWRARKQQWAESVVETLGDIVFAMAKRGASKTDIADFFGISPDQVTNRFDEPWAMGRADLRMRINDRTVAMALESKMPVGVIWAGKIFNGFTEQVAVTEQEDASGVTFNVRIATKPKDPVPVATDEEAPTDRTWAH